MRLKEPHRTIKLVLKNYYTSSDFEIYFRFPAVNHTKVYDTAVNMINAFQNEVGDYSEGNLESLMIDLDLELRKYDAELFSVDSTINL